MHAFMRRKAAKHPLLFRIDAITHSRVQGHLLRALCASRSWICFRFFASATLCQSSSLGLVLGAILGRRAVLESLGSVWWKGDMDRVRCYTATSSVTAYKCTTGWERAAWLEPLTPNEQPGNLGSHDSLMICTSSELRKEQNARQRWMGYGTSSSASGLTSFWLGLVLRIV